MQFRPTSKFKVHCTSIFPFPSGPLWHVNPLIFDFTCHQVREREEKLDEERIARGEAPKGMEAQWRPGVAYEGKQLASAHNFHKGVDVFAAPVKVNVVQYAVYSSAILLLHVSFAI